MRLYVSIRSLYLLIIAVGALVAVAFLTTIYEVLPVLTWGLVAAELFLVALVLYRTRYPIEARRDATQQAREMIILAVGLGVLSVLSIERYLANGDYFQAVLASTLGVVIIGQLFLALRLVKAQSRV